MARRKARSAWIKKSGPYKVISLINGNMLLQPSWGQYGEVWHPEHGGGPGVMGRMGLAEDLERWLNSVYSEAEIVEAMERIHEHERKLHPPNLQSPLAPSSV